jgi:hypothetical protein
MTIDPFDAHIKPDGGHALVIGSAIVGGACVLAGLVLSEPLLVLAALLAFAVSLYNYPLLNPNEAHLSASLHGLEIDGLGTIDWHSIKTIDRKDVEGKAHAQCKLTQTLEKAVKKADGTSSALRSVQVTIWRLPDQHTLAIDLSRFKEKPEEVLSAMNRFHARARGD